MTNMQVVSVYAPHAYLVVSILVDEIVSLVNDILRVANEVANVVQGDENVGLVDDIIGARLAYQITFEEFVKLLKILISVDL